MAIFFFQRWRFSNSQGKGGKSRCIQDLQRPQGGHGVFVLFLTRRDPFEPSEEMRGRLARTGTIVMADQNYYYYNIPCNNNDQIITIKNTSAFARHCFSRVSTTSD
jgi:hypothetical protein